MTSVVTVVCLWPLRLRAQPQPQTVVKPLLLVESQEAPTAAALSLSPTSSQVVSGTSAVAARQNALLMMHFAPSSSVVASSPLRAQTGSRARNQQREEAAAARIAQVKAAQLASPGGMASLMTSHLDQTGIEEETEEADDNEDEADKDGGNTAMNSASDSDSDNAEVQALITLRSRPVTPVRPRTPLAPVLPPPLPPPLPPATPRAQQLPVPVPAPPPLPPPAVLQVVLPPTVLMLAPGATSVDASAPAAPSFPAARSRASSAAVVPVAGHDPAVASPSPPPQQPSNSLYAVSVADGNKGFLTAARPAIDSLAATLPQILPPVAPSPPPSNHFAT
jgi:hypothetical protein